MSIKKITQLLCFVLWFSGCSSEDDTEQPEAITLTDVLIEVVYFEFTPDTGNNSQRLQYEIKFTNPNSVAVSGFYRITTVADGLQATSFSSDRSPCYTIEANSDCSYVFDEEDSFDLGRINAIELVSVEYVLED